MTATVVELCGLPGSGKSTLAALAREALIHQDVPTHIADANVSADVAKPVRVTRRAGLALAEGVRHPQRTVSTARLVRATGQAAMRDNAAVLAQWLALCRLLARARAGQGVQLVEEGPVQTLWTLGLRGDAARAERLWERVPGIVRADLLVVVDAPAPVVVDRLAARPSRHSRTQRLAREAQLPELEHGQVLLDRLVGHAGMPTLRLENDGSVPLETLARDVAQACRARHARSVV